MTKATVKMAELGQGEDKAGCIKMRPEDKQNGCRSPQLPFINKGGSYESMEIGERVRRR